MKQALLYALALICIGLAIAGAFLPLLPTTPFLLAAASLSAKASPRLHRWLLNHPWFGQSIRHYQTHKAMSPQAFRNAMFVLWPTMLLSMYWLQSLWVCVLLSLIGGGVSLMLWRARRRGIKVLS